MESSDGEARMDAAGVAGGVPESAGDRFQDREAEGEGATWNGLVCQASSGMRADRAGLWRLACRGEVPLRGEGKYRLRFNTY